jgi:hypothetical protein
MLRKSRIDGTWLIIDPSRNRVVAGGEHASSSGANGWRLSNVEHYLKEERQT